MEKKTIEEAAKISYEENVELNRIFFQDEVFAIGFKAGAEWYAKNQSEQSEDEIIQLKVENQNLINEIHQLRLRINSLLGWKTYAK